MLMCTIFQKTRTHQRSIIEAYENNRLMVSSA
jgi:hypothetical protein